MFLDRRVSLIAFIATVLAAVPRPAAAQQSMSDVLTFLLTNQAVITGDFVKDRAAAAMTSDTLSRFLQIELGALPITSSTGGFIYRFNRDFGTMERASDSFGPFYVERALTSGRGQRSLGIAYRRVAFNALDGRSLANGDIVSTANHLAGEQAPFDVERLFLRLEADTVTLLGSIGVSDRLDLTAAVPVVSLRLDGSRLNHYRGSVFQQAIGSGTVTGLADMAVRAKYNLLRMRSVGVGADVDLRLPTGSRDDLLGTGRMSGRVHGILSMEHPRLGGHIRAGLARGGASDATEYGAAVVATAGTRLNIVGEVFGHRLSGLARIGDVAAPHPVIPNVTTTRLVPVSHGVNTALAVAGVKLNVGRTFLVNVHVLFPLTDTGLRAKPSPAVALDYTFTRP